MNKLIQISNAEGSLYGLDESGQVWQYVVPYSRHHGAGEPYWAKVKMQTRD